MAQTLDIEKLYKTPLKVEPYDYLVVEQFIKRGAFDDVIKDFPEIGEAGSFPPELLDIQGCFACLLREMNAPEFRQAVEDKFSLDLSIYPTMFTIRGQCARYNGKIHRDSETKIITVLLYMNDIKWQSEGGRLRILNNQHDLNDFTEEINPGGGTLLVFRRCENSWHGHEPYEGIRRAIQMNWVTNDNVIAREGRRHKFSAFTKKINPFRAISSMK